MNAKTSCEFPRLAEEVSKALDADGSTEDMLKSGKFHRRDGDFMAFLHFFGIFRDSTSLDG